MKKPLEGVRILDTTSFLSAPFGTQILGGLGAEVIKIEEPIHGDPSRTMGPFVGRHGISFDKQSNEDESLSILKRNRNKKSITLNLSSKKGKEIFKQMVRKSDVVVENYAYGVAEKWGLDYAKVKEINPRIIYCSLSGFGHSGPYKHLTAFDPTAQAMSGAMAVTGFADGIPLRTGVGIGDMVPALYAVIGILVALHYRDKTGKGQAIDISMQDSVFSMVLMEHLEVHKAFGFPIRAGNRLYRVAPLNAYKAKDGYVVITAAFEPQWNNLLRVINRSELIADPRFDTQWKKLRNMDEIDSMIEEWIEGKTVSEAIAELENYRIPCGRVIEDIEELLSDSQLLAREMITNLKHPTIGTIEGIKAPGMPIKFSESEARYDVTCPSLGQHNKEIYSSLLGYSDAELSKLKEEGVI